MRERILATAGRLFYQRGIRAVGVDTIAAEAGISKRSLYDHFPAKADLVVAYLNGHAGPHAPSDGPPEMQILKVFDRLERAFAREDFHGCPFVNAVAEFGDSAEIRAAALAVKEERRLWFRERLSAMGIAGADWLATQLAILVDGAIAAGLVRHDPAMARAARDAARRLIEVARNQTPCGLL